MKRAGLLKPVGYGIGSLGKDLSLGVIMSYLMLFYTDILGISVYAAGMILTVARIWDASNDVIMGAIVDRTNTRWGRSRPYLLFVPVPLAVFSALCFFAPGLSPTGKVAYAAVTYLIYGMLFTMYDVPLWGMLPVVSSDAHERTRYITWANFFTSLALMLSSTFAMPLAGRLGGGKEPAHLQKGFFLLMLMIGAASVIFAWVTFACMKEGARTRIKPNSGDILNDLKVLRQKPVALLFLVAVTNSVARMIPSVVGVYYMIYYMKRPDLVPAYMLLSRGVGMLAMPLLPALLQRVSPKQVILGSMFASLICNVLIFVAVPEQTVFLFMMFVLSNLFTAPTTVAMKSLMAESADYVAASNGQRRDGILFSLHSFAIKIGMALANLVASLMLGMTGYVPNSPDQLPQAIAGIQMVRSLIPAAFTLLSILLIRAYALPRSGESDKNGFLSG